MGILYENLDERTREFMIQELNLDISNGRLYKSQRLNSFGQETWSEILREAVQSHNDDWLADQLQTRGCFETYEPRKTRGRITMVKVPKNASETLAEGEFNRFYARALCSIESKTEYLRLKFAEESKSNNHDQSQ